MNHSTHLPIEEQYTIAEATLSSYAQLPAEVRSTFSGRKVQEARYCIEKGGLYNDPIPTEVHSTLEAIARALDTQLS